MNKIFLESHNLRNFYSGLGQFNFHLINALVQQDSADFRFIVNTSEQNKYKKIWGDKVEYHRYWGFSRYNAFRPRTTANIWHSLNQNTKVEPANSIPYLMTVHDVNFVESISSDMNHEVNQRFIQKLQKSHALVYISEYAKKSTHQYFEVPKVPESIIYNGNSIHVEEYPKNHIPEFQPHFRFLFSIGEFREKKNFHTLVDMLRFLPNDLHLIIAGSPKEPYVSEVKAHIQENKLEERVHLVGRITEWDKYYYYQNTEAFVFPSLREGFGIPPIEAMNFGVPIFLSDKTSLPEVGGESAFYWTHFDPEYMAEVYQKGITEFNANPDFYIQKYKENAARFSWDTAAQQYLEVYNSLI